MTERPVDQPQRDAALDVARSFIVQAPAGSGKTGLLTQRYLALLARVEAPEEIVAITFTRKAAAEMRERILGALQAAAEGRAPASEHARRTLELAAAALRRDGEQGWAILQHPMRLRILTFDSLCASLVRQMPVLSGFGAAPAVVEDARPHYREAASRILEELESEGHSGHAVAALLRHLDNRHDRVQSLVAGMLAHRDQWLRHLTGNDEPRNRQRLEAALQHIIVAALARAREAFPAEHKTKLVELLHFASDRLGPDSALAACRELDDLPPATITALPCWHALADWLLTAQGSLRKSITKNQGFPPKSAGSTAEERARFEAMKLAMKDLLEALQQQQIFADALAALRLLPAPRYTVAQWQVLEALFTLLVRAAAHLRVVFQESGEVDFAEVAVQAVAALGEPDAPTDLALQLDYRIRHLLVDEFQDTSINQYELLRRLTAGWTPDDGRTLFLVGDPMQSIYRFREAEVGLFLDVKRHGLGDVRPQFLQLSVNFRSQQGIVDWVNAGFPRIFPARDDEQAGAVAYSPSQAFNAGLPGPAVQIHPFAPGEHAAEAQTVARLVRDALAAAPDTTVAVLVRSRSHLLHIVPALREAGIRYQAVEIDPLAARPVVQDLLSLARALIHPADRIAWLALLRSPLCGLDRSDLLILAGGPDSIIFERLDDAGVRQSLSADAQRILQRVVPVLQAAHERRGRMPLRDRIEQAWLALGGPACVASAVDLADARTFLERLDALDAGGDVIDYGQLLEAVEELYARPDTGDAARVQLMTIHKAKGLEFDTVILPGIGREPRRDDTRLLYWQEQPLEGGEAVLLFSPVPGAGEETPATVAYLRRLEEIKRHHEDQRLLYVAVTRARRQLHLTGQAKRNADGEIVPAGRSLLELLWPVVGPEFVARLDAIDEAPSEPETESLPLQVPMQLRRLPPDWSCPAPPDPVAVNTDELPLPEVPPIEYDWAGETARHVGTVVHRWLEYLGRLDDVARDAFAPAGKRETIARFLQQAGVPASRLTEAADRVVQALEQVLADARGRWILSSRHAEARCEYPLTGIVDGVPRHYVVDRTFIDDDGVRWIIDYKTSRHEGGGLDAFLDQEVERYRAQLEGYARLFAQQEARPIRLGLYFPLLCGWREWAFDTGDS